jgi:hypothetical protein
MPTKPSRTLLQARSALLDKDIELHDLQERFAALEAQNSELGQTVVDQGGLLEATRQECADLQGVINDRDKTISIMRNDIAFYLQRVAYFATPELEQLLQFLERPIWDGDLVSKGARDRLMQQGYVERIDGFNLLSSGGVHLLIQLGKLPTNRSDSVAMQKAA